jgi:hypothetical protein
VPLLAGSEPRTRPEDDGTENVRSSDGGAAYEASPCVSTEIRASVTDVSRRCTGAETGERGRTVGADHLVAPYRTCPVGPFITLPPDDTTSLNRLTDSRQPLIGAHPRVERYLNERRLKN